MSRQMRLRAGQMAPLVLRACIAGGGLLSAAAFPAQIALAQSMGGERASGEQGTAPSTLLLRGTSGSGETGIALEEDDLLPNSVNAGTTLVAMPVPRPTVARETAQQGAARPAQPEPQVLDPLSTGTPSPRSNIAQAPEQGGTAVALEEDPFAAEGLRIGSWAANVTLDQGIGYSTNLSQTALRNPSAFSQTRLSVSARSNWSRHEASISAEGGYRRSIGSDIEETPDASVNAGLRLDLVDGMTARLGAGYDYRTEAATSTNLPATAVNRPGVHALEGNAELERSGGRLGFVLRGAAVRTLHEDVELSGGGSFDQADRDNTLLTVTGRVSYEVSPVVTPFVEAEAGIRRFDLETDRNGEDRDSNILALRGGAAIDFGEKLRGEISAGYRIEDYEDPVLATLEGWTLDGNLTWSPQRGSEVVLSNSTDFASSTIAGDSGQIVNSTSLTASRQVNDRLSLEARAGVDITREGSGKVTDRLWSAGAGLQWWLNRHAAVTLDVDHSTRVNEDALNSFDDTSIRAGIRLQR